MNSAFPAPKKSILPGPRSSALQLSVAGCLLSAALSLPAFAQTNVFPSAGNVGIGTTSPRSRLDLGSSLGAGNGARLGDYLEINEREVINNALTIGWNAHIAADDGTFAPTYAPGTGMVLTMAAGGYGDLDFYGKNWAGDETPKDLSVFTHIMRLSTNGNVGIGTTVPSGTWGKVLQISNSSGSAGISLKTGVATARQWDIGVNPAAGGSSQDLDIYDATAGEHRFVIQGSTGNVGIGTITPTHKLAVNGTVRAKEVIVDTGWADYVFAKGYRLTPLAEVEQHIEKEGRLPGIPSAAEVAEHGVSMGEMQAKLLAKVEELTLHQIAQEKLLKAQQTEISALRQQLSTLNSPP